MEIESITTHTVRIPVRHHTEPLGVAPYVSGGRLSGFDRDISFEEALERNEAASDAGHKLLVELETTTGTMGWGEMRVRNPGPGGAAVDDDVGVTMLEKMIAPVAIGMDVWEIESLTESFSSFPAAYYRDIRPFVAAVEMAMWDAWGKELGVPVHQLLGGKCSEHVEVAYVVGIHDMETSAELAKRALDAGFSTVKTKGSHFWKSDVERISRMYDAVDGELEFRLDPNQIWGYEDAVRATSLLQDRGIYLQFLEQPIGISNLETHARLRQRLTTPIGVNEDTYYPERFEDILHTSAADVVVLDVIPAGGISGLKKLAALGEQAGISMTHHSNFDLGIKMAAKLHLAASTPGMNLPLDSVYYAYDHCLFEDPLEYEQGRIRVPDRSGLAGPVDRATLREWRIE